MDWTSKLTAGATTVVSIDVNAKPFGMNVENPAYDFDRDNLNDIEVYINGTKRTDVTVDSYNPNWRMVSVLIPVTVSSSGSGSTHSHSWATEWTPDGTHHWHECAAAGCDIADNSAKNGYAAHDYSDDTDTACNTCGHVRTITTDKENYPVWLGSTQVTSANKGNILADGTASYDPDTKTLTLKGYNGSDIWADHALTIHVAGDSTITVPETAERNGVYTNGECKLTGGGDLNIVVAHGDCRGIWANYTTSDAKDGNLIIEMSGNLTVNAKDDALYASNDLTISGSGNISITGRYSGLHAANGAIYINGSGDLTVKSGDDGIWANNDIEISGSRNVTVEAVDRSLCPYYGRLILSGSGSVTATSTGGTLLKATMRTRLLS